MKKAVVLFSLIAFLMIPLIVGCAEVGGRDQSASSVQTSPTATSQSRTYLDAGTFGMKVYYTNSGFYPFVMAYFRTIDANREPLVNLTPFNIGLMVKGKAYDPYKKQYYIETLERRTEGFRTAIVLDCSASMAGGPFRDGVEACKDFIRLKRPTDEVAIIALTDEVVNVCPFTRDGSKAIMFLKSLRPVGQRTPLFQGISVAMQACATAPGTTFAGSGGRPGYVVLSNILVLSDGVDRGGIISKDNLLSKIINMHPPIPIYALVYSEYPDSRMGELEAISEASFGRAWYVKSNSHFAHICQKIHNINRHDYVLTFRSYLPVDGEEHNFKIMVDYEGRAHYSNGRFEAIEVPAFNEAIRRAKMALERKIPPLPEGETPYMTSKQPGASKYSVQPPKTPQKPSK